MNSLLSFICLCGFSFPFCLCTRTQGINYVVDVTHPHQKAFHVTMQVPASSGLLQVSMPMSAPGSTNSFNAARYVVHVAAQDTHGASLTVERLDKQTWGISVPISEVVSIQYDVLLNTADKLRLQSNWIDEQTGGFFNGASLFLYSPSLLRRPVSLTLKLPNNWQTVTSLTGTGDGAFVAANYRQLLDHPVQFGVLEERDLEAAETHWRLIFDAPLPPYNKQAFDENLRKIIAAEIHIMRGVPFREFTVFFHWRPDLEYGGGMEFGQDIIMNIGKDWMEDLPDDVSGTFAHELFHSWNAIAMYPRGFDHWDYAKENYTNLMWFQEGVTSYYAVLAMVRGGVRPDRFFDMLSNALTTFEGQNGRGFISLADASVADWIDPVESIDFYSSGEVVGFLLDCQIRHETHGRHSLDDVMHLLYEQSRQPRYMGYDEADLVRAVNTAGGRDLGPFLLSLVHTNRTIDYNTLLHGLGATVTIAQEQGQKTFSIQLSKDLSDEQRTFWQAIQFASDK